ncbi:MAG: SDR family mycofactocin-dependent oxidoreductase [Solirubrobacterales bacterium]|nr:SDR family mycofactocin-dependent oxidoreductase [Solirubrobacterales bacterium]
MPVAVVTGAARGIGAAAAAGLASAGWRVGLIDIADQTGGGEARPEPSGEAELRDTVEACGKGTEAIGVVADVRSATAVADAVAEIEAELGPVDAAVAAAGRIAGGEAWDTDGAVWRELFDVNFHGVRHLVEAVVPGMLERGGPGRFVAVASAAAGRAHPRLSAYGASKNAVVGYVKGLAADLRGTEVTANVVSPGSTDTEMLAASAEVYGLADPGEFAPHQLLDRLLRPEEVAATIRFLCGPEASGLTGAVIPADGGMTA